MPSKIFHTLWVLSALAITLTPAAHAAGMGLERMLVVVDQRMGSNTRRENAIEAGRDRAFLCQYCHGEDGNSKKPDVPNLAGQNVRYLLEQIQHFADGSRKDYVMNQLAEKFSDEDKINLAVFYTSMKIKPQTVDAALAAKGRVVFTKICSNCHGDQGHGNQSLARLAGQQQEYVKAVLNYFRDAANNPARRAEGKRTSTLMEQFTKDLKDDEIAAVAAFVAQLP